MREGVCGSFLGGSSWVGEDLGPVLELTDNRGDGLALGKVSWKLLNNLSDDGSSGNDVGDGSLLEVVDSGLDLLGEGTTILEALLNLWLNVITSDSIDKSRDELLGVKNAEVNGSVSTSLNGISFELEVAPGALHLLEEGWSSIKTELDITSTTDKVDAADIDTEDGWDGNTGIEMDVD